MTGSPRTFGKITIPMTEAMIPLAEMAVAVLTTADGRAKTALSRNHAAQWKAARG